MVSFFFDVWDEEVSTSQISSWGVFVHVLVGLIIYYEIYDCFMENRIAGGTK